MRASPYRFLLAFALFAGGLSLTITPAASQQPLPVGTTTAWGMGGMTEARFAEAALWNPALLSLHDGPLKSFSLLNAVVEPGDLNDAVDFYGFFRDPASGTVDPGFASTLKASRVNAGDPARYTGFGGMQWLGLHAEDLAISASSYLYWRQQVPERAIGILSTHEEAIADPVSDAELDAARALPSQYTTASVVALAKGSSQQQLDVLGPTWLGFTLKGGIIHEHTEGRFQYGDARDLATNDDGVLMSDDLDPGAGDVGTRYEELGVRDTKMAAADLGLVANPLPPLLVSLTAVNALQLTWLDENTLYRRTLDAVGPTTSGRTRVFHNERPLDIEDEDADRAKQADDLLDATHFLRLVRLGGSIDTRWGRLAGGASIPLENGAIDRPFQDRYTVGFQPFLDLAPRFSVSRGMDGSTALRAGLQHGFCDTRVALGVGYRSGGTRGSSLEATLSWSFGRPPCGQY